MILISLYITDQQKKQLGDLGQRTGLPMAEHMRRAIDTYFVLGCMSGSPYMFTSGSLRP